MSGHNRSRRWGAVGAVLLAACAGNPAPSGWLPSPMQVPTDPYGAWIDVRLLYHDAVGGEFIAVGSDSVFVLTDAGQLVGLSMTAIHDARIAYYTSQWGNLALWTTVGSLGTISHGWGAALTLPLWLIIGPIATASQSRAPFVHIRNASQWADARAFARFPQGLPDGLDRRVLRPRGAVGAGAHR